MTITRNGVEIQLTEAEINQAHKEWFHQFSIEDIDYYAECIYDGEFADKYNLTEEQVEEIYHMATDEYGKYIMDYITDEKMDDWKYETIRECINNALKALKLRK